MADRGGIQNVEAYARGKMLDHSGWQKEEKLPRNVTPSDIDVVFDNNSWMLFCEISSKHAAWDDLKKESMGQFLLYRNLIFQTTNCAVLCKHSVRLDALRPIDTKKDITAFQVMLYSPGCGVVQTRVFKNNGWWQQLVHRWYEDAKALHANLIGQATGEEA